MELSHRAACFPWLIVLIAKCGEISRPFAISAAAARELERRSDLTCLEIQGLANRDAPKEVIEAADREARGLARDLLERSQYLVTDDFLTFRNGLFTLRLELMLRRRASVMLTAGLLLQVDEARGHSRAYRKTCIAEPGMLSWSK